MLIAFCVDRSVYVYVVLDLAVLCLFCLTNATFLCLSLFFMALYSLLHMDLHIHVYRSAAPLHFLRSVISFINFSVYLLVCDVLDHNQKKEKQDLVKPEESSQLKQRLLSQFDTTCRSNINTLRRGFGSFAKHASKNLFVISQASCKYFRNS